MQRQASIIESEWVRAGPDFALSHPIAQRLGAVWLIVGWVIVHLLLLCLALYEISTAQDLGWGLDALFIVLIVLLIANDLAAVATLIGRHPLARPSVWLCLIVSFPLSLPLVVYWADGIRPNLIYAHRFQRLVWPPEDQS